MAARLLPPLQSRIPNLGRRLAAGCALPLTHTLQVAGPAAPAGYQERKRILQSLDAAFPNKQALQSVEHWADIASEDVPADR